MINLSDQTDLCQMKKGSLGSLTIHLAPVDFTIETVPVPVDETVQI